MKVGIPAGIQGILFSLSNVVIQSSVNSFGEIVMAGNAAANNIETFIYASVNAFYQANISFTSQNLGAGRMDRIRMICTLYALCGLMDVIVGSVRGIGYALTPMVITLIGACGLRILWVSVLFQIPAFHTVQTIYISYPISWTVTFLAQLTCYCLGMRRLKRRMGETENTPDAA